MPSDCRQRYTFQYFLFIESKTVGMIEDQVLNFKIKCFGSTRSRVQIPTPRLVSQRIANITIRKRYEQQKLFWTLFLSYRLPFVPIQYCRVEFKRVRFIIYTTKQLSQKYTYDLPSIKKVALTSWKKCKCRMTFRQLRLPQAMVNRLGEVPNDTKHREQELMVMPPFPT